MVNGMNTQTHHDAASAITQQALRLGFPKRNKVTNGRTPSDAQKRQAGSNDGSGAHHHRRVHRPRDIQLHTWHEITPPPPNKPARQHNPERQHCCPSSPTLDS